VPLLIPKDGDSWDGENLLPRIVKGVEYKIQRYRPRIEGLFARIERWTNAKTGEVHWRSISKNNILTLYGKDTNSRIADPADPRRIFSWLICETRDDKGNAILYDYKAEDGTGVDLTRAHERNRGGSSRPKKSQTLERLSIRSSSKMRSARTSQCQRWTSRAR
jgi:Salmonella virulence plasmid 65kDa B protein